MTSVTTPLDAFAEQYRLRITRDAYNERIIAAKHGSLITDYGDGRLSVLLLGRSARWWNGRRQALVAAGCRLEQDGDAEGSLSFEPDNAVACALAVKFAGIKRRRQASAAQLANLRADAGEKTRFQAAKSGDRTPGIPGAYPAVP
jgi:hypothetical protein